MAEFVEIAPDVWRLSLAPRGSVNVYLLGGVLVDTGGRTQVHKLLAALAGRRVVAHAITHAHFDHQGGSHVICERLDIPLWCGADDREAMETGAFERVMPRPASRLAQLQKWLCGPPHPVSRALHDWDVVGGGFVALETPGHTPGHIAFWRESDRVLVLGDAAMNCNPMTLRRRLREPFPWATHDPVQARASLRRLAALAPEIVCFGHGEPIPGPERFLPFVQGLSSR